MPSAPAAIAVEQAQTRQNVALSVIKSSAEQDQAVAQILEESSRTAPTSQSRGTNVNISV